MNAWRLVDITKAKAALRRATRRWLLGVVAWTMVSAWGDRAGGQAPAGWKPPPETIVLDFSAPHADRHLVFLDDGMAIEIFCRFMMVQHDRVRVEASLPEPGTCKFQLHSPDARVEIQPQRVQGRRAAADVVSKLRALGPEELNERVRQVIGAILGPVEKQVREQAASLGRSQYRKYLNDHEIALPPAKTKEAEDRLLRETYVTARTIELAQPKIREALDALADMRPEWIAPQDRAAFRTLRTRALLDAWEDLVACDLIDKYLKSVGLAVPTERANYRNRLAARSAALYLVLSGKAAAGEAAAVAKGLTLDEQNRLRQFLSVELCCRFYPEVDPKDPNGQWFHGQRVGASARGVASIRLEGRLDPKQHDRTDWWILDGYQEQTTVLQWPRGVGFRVDPPYVDARGTMLRVTATGEGPVDYAIILQPSKPMAGGLEVVVPETRNLPNRTFPY